MLRFSLIALLLFVLTPRSVDAERARPIRLMPMGDSITLGENPHVSEASWVGYRLPLYQRLTDAGLQFDFVGSIQVGDARLPDRDLEAKGGKTIAEIAGWARERVALQQPDVILLMAGTNDAAQGLSADVGPRYRVLLQQIREGQPDAEVLAATIPQIGYAPWAVHVPAINDGIRWAVAQERAAGQRVTLVETPTGIALSSDGVHPAETGYGTLGEMWANAVLRTYTMACSQPARVVVRSERGAPGQLRVTVTSMAGAIERVSFGQPSGAHPVADLTLSPQSARFTVVRSGVGPSTQPFTVTDRCGSWSSFVGGGPSAF